MMMAEINSTAQVQIGIEAMVSRAQLAVMFRGAMIDTSESHQPLLHENQLRTLLLQSFDRAVLGGFIEPRRVIEHSNWTTSKIKLLRLNIAFL